MTHLRLLGRSAHPWFVRGYCSSWVPPTCLLCEASCQPSVIIWYLVYYLLCLSSHLTISALSRSWFMSVACLGLIFRSSPSDLMAFRTSCIIHAFIVPYLTDITEFVLDALLPCDGLQIIGAARYITLTLLSL